jgi:hypothetical protein
VSRSAEVPPPNWYWPAGRVDAGPAVVFDLDGVLSDASGRQHLLGGSARPDWDAFFQAAAMDPLIPEVARLLELLDPALRVVLLTARPAHIRTDTVEWLALHRLRYDLLVMRTSGDFQKAVEFKRRQVEALRAFGFDLRLALEDDRRNLEMFEQEEIPCLYVHSGYYG